LGNRWLRAYLPTLVIGLSLTLSGCAFGPKQLTRTHGAYSEAVRRVDEEELLLNLVHARYSESPRALDVTAIAAQWELSASAEARPFFGTPNANNFGFKSFIAILPDFMLAGYDRPTVSMKPSLDATGIRQFLTPITAETLVFLIQSGWPISSVMRLWVERLNGVPNASPIGGPPHDSTTDYARFRRIADLMQVSKDHELMTLHGEDRVKEMSSPVPAEAVTTAAIVEAAKSGFEYRRHSDGKSWVLVKMERKLVLEVTPGCEGAPELADLASLLNLRRGEKRYEFELVAGGVTDPARHPSEPTNILRIMPRATAQVFLYLTNGVEVPADHFKCGLVQPTMNSEGQVMDSRDVTDGLFQIHCCRGRKPPPCAYVAVKYRDHWFYIDDRDHASKESFSLVLLLSRLDFKRQRIVGDEGPTLTLPVGGR
jgi:hypothetical protein